MKKLILVSLALLSPVLASANQDLQMALGSLNEAKMAISQGRAQHATNSILQAESSIYRAMSHGNGGLPNRRAWLCQFAYKNEAFEGRGATEQEARNMLLNNCLRSRPEYGSVCKTFVDNPYISTCVERSF